MSDEVDIPTDQDIVEKVFSTINTQTVRTKKLVMWTSPEDTMWAELDFGNGMGDAFALEATQMWFITGELLTQFLDNDAVGTTRREVIKDIALKIVDQIQNNQTLKDNLLASGDLVIKRTSFASMVGPI